MSISFICQCPPEVGTVVCPIIELINQILGLKSIMGFIKKWVHLINHPGRILQWHSIDAPLIWRTFSIILSKRWLFANPRKSWAGIHLRGRHFKGYFEDTELYRKISTTFASPLLQYRQSLVCCWYIHPFGIRKSKGQPAGRTRSFDSHGNLESAVNPLLTALSTRLDPELLSGTCSCKKVSKDSNSTPASIPRSFSSRGYE